jgi:hypothetical protein
MSPMIPARRSQPDSAGKGEQGPRRSCVLSSGRRLCCAKTEPDTRTCIGSRLGPALTAASTLLRARRQRVGRWLRRWTDLHATCASAHQASGYKTIEAAGLDLGPVTVLVGPNGAGKSTFVEPVEPVEPVELPGRVAGGELRIETGSVARPPPRSARTPRQPPSGCGWRQKSEDASMPMTSCWSRHAPGEPLFAHELVEFDHDEAGEPGAWREETDRGRREPRLPQAARETEPGALSSAPLRTLAILRGCRTFRFQDTSPGAPVKCGQDGDARQASACRSRTAARCVLVSMSWLWTAGCSPRHPAGPRAAHGARRHRRPR